MTEGTVIFGAAVAAVLLGAIAIGGPVACSIQEAQQITERVKAACVGDLNEAARSAACTLALMQRPQR